MSKFHALVYVENCTPKIKKFKTLRALKTFVTKFENKYPDPDKTGDNWIDYHVTNIEGEVVFYSQDEECRLS